MTDNDKAGKLWQTRVSCQYIIQTLVLTFSSSSPGGSLGARQSVMLGHLTAALPRLLPHIKKPAARLALTQSPLPTALPADKLLPVLFPSAGRT